MPMTVVVTRNVSDRVRGFLSSSMLELAPGVYSGARMSSAVRQRVWGGIGGLVSGRSGREHRDGVARASGPGWAASEVARCAAGGSGRDGWCCPC